MKKFSLLLSLFILAAVFCFSQNTYYEDISFSYLRSPLQPLSTEFKTYAVIANVDYAADIASQKENWQKSKEEALQQNESEKQEYKEKSLGNKLVSRALLDEEKPKDIIIGAKYFSKVYDAADVSSRIKFDGYEVSTSSDLKIEVILLGFEYLIEEDITEKTKDDVTTKEYSYKISYKHPMEIKLFDGFDEEINYSELANFKSFQTKNTKKFSSSYSLEKYWKENKISYLSKLDEKVTRDNLKTINNYLNSQFGYSTIEKNSAIAMVKPKKFEYPEYFNAYEQIFTGYTYLLDNKNDAVNYINEAITNWETALKESDKENKKARVNLKVTAVTHLNCAEAYCWLNDFQNARRHIMKIKMLKTKKYDKKVEELQNFMEDQERRYKASQAM
ncbi:MAG: hypothetical protein JEY96_09875 [Bacteroidales bacterium]|nr:hypothetical protein [Bacteroidales bacterium]